MQSGYVFWIININNNNSSSARLMEYLQKTSNLLSICYYNGTPRFLQPAAIHAVALPRLITWHGWQTNVKLSNASKGKLF